MQWSFVDVRIHVYITCRIGGGENLQCTGNTDRMKKILQESPKFDYYSKLKIELQQAGRNRILVMAKIHVHDYMGKGKNIGGGVDITFYAEEVPLSTAAAFSVSATFHCLLALDFSYFLRNGGTVCPAFLAIFTRAGEHTLS